MEVAEFLCSYCRVFVPLLKSRFFVIYYRCVTLADGMGGGTKAPPYIYRSFIAVGRGFTPAAKYAIISLTVGNGFPDPKKARN